MRSTASVITMLLVLGREKERERDIYLFRRYIPLSSFVQRDSGERRETVMDFENYCWSGVGNKRFRIIDLWNNYYWILMSNSE